MKYSPVAFSAFPTMVSGYAFPSFGLLDRVLEDDRAHDSSNARDNGDVVLRSLQDPMPLTPFGTMERFFDHELFSAPRIDFPSLRDLDGRLHTANRIAPKYDISENDDQFQLTMELPGVRPEDCSVSLENGGKILRLSGGRKVKQENSVIETRFEQKFTLRRDLDTDKIEANLADGVMVITAPKKATLIPEPRYIKVLGQAPVLFGDGMKKGDDKREENGNDDLFELSLDMPGVRAEDCTVKLENEGRVLRVSGVRKFLKKTEMIERRFDQRFTVGNFVDGSNLTANLVDGVMYIMAPIKKEVGQPTSRNILISSGRPHLLKLAEDSKEDHAMDLGESKEGATLVE